MLQTALRRAWLTVCQLPLLFHASISDFWVLITTDFCAESKRLLIRSGVQSSLPPLCQLTTSLTAKLHQRGACLLLNNSNCSSSSSNMVIQTKPRTRNYSALSLYVFFLYDCYFSQIMRALNSTRKSWDTCKGSGPRAVKQSDAQVHDIWKLTTGPWIAGWEGSSESMNMMINSKKWPPHSAKSCPSPQAVVCLAPCTHLCSPLWLHHLTDLCLSFDSGRKS